ncbi:cytochrome P450 [Streptomyces sp. NPDC047014]|uniref:cytochrome P450 n=1 Tax=Streptomyces sp. NPDC047014 TaxID=3155736 RepID=UPI0033C79ACF
MNDPTPPTVDYPLPSGEHGAPSPLFDTLRREHHLARIRTASGQVTWLVTRHADITAIATDRRFSRDLTRGNTVALPRDDFNAVPGGIFNLDPPDHSRVRRILQPHFSPAAAGALQPAVAAHAHRLIDALAQGPNPADLVAAYSRPLALHMACELMRVPAEQRARIVGDLRVQMDTVAPSVLVGSSTAHLLEFADEVLATPPGSGPVAALTRAHEAGTISADELRGTVMYLFLTSAEPVMGPTTTGVYTLTRHPDILHRLQDSGDSDEPWDEAVWELLRFHHNSNSSLPRVATEDVTLSGTTIRRGDHVITPFVAASNDPARFKAPHKFRTGRAAAEDPQVTFGSGPHYCLGVNIARMHLRTALRTLWQRLPRLTLAVKHQDVPWEPREFLFTRPTHLPVVW